ncbi:hypothetical protein CYY_003006 [Polysphondylium violaceum]|uniref:Rab GTPase n=1 Tax=Polysphondylium violaceum TaxID=133409 RepID=A0A8J4PVF3_9MYCE|nr:hypothetical protein CYY_003006 [Polysphondylium violaceum]
MPTYQSTIGTDLRVKQFDDPHYTLILQVWDKYRGWEYRGKTGAPPSYYRNASAIFIFFDVTNRESFEFAKHEIASIPHDEYEQELYIVGSKIDLETQRVISREEGLKLAQEYAAQYYEVSAKDNLNIQQMFDEVALALFDKKKTYPDVPRKEIPCIEPPPPQPFCIVQ